MSWTIDYDLGIITLKNQHKDDNEGDHFSSDALRVEKTFRDLIKIHLIIIVSKRKN